MKTIISYAAFAIITVLIVSGVYTGSGFEPGALPGSARISDRDIQSDGDVVVKLDGKGITSEKLAEMVASGEIPGNVTVLWLFGNNLTDIGALGGLTELTCLLLDENKITDITALGNLKNLKILAIGKNEIEDIGILKELTGLNELHCGHNKITKINVLEGLVNLEQLNVYNNRIGDISVLYGMKSLAELWIDSRQITEKQALRLQNDLPNCKIFM